MQQQITSNNIEIDFQSFFYNSHLPMVLLTTDLRFKAVNRGILRITNYTEEEILGKSINKFTVLDDLGFDIENLKKLLDNEIHSYTVERTYLTKAGTVIEGAVTVSLIDFEGETLVFSIFHDRMESLQKDGLEPNDNSALNKILSINPDIHYILDIQNKNYVYQNVDILNYFGYSEKDLKGKSVVDFLISKIDSTSINEVNQASNDFRKGIPLGEFMMVEYKFLSNNEGWKWLRAKSTPLSTNASGALVLCYGFIQDITSQKEMELKLLGQEAFINQIANLVPDVLAVYDLNTFDLIYSNLNHRTFLGYNKDEWKDYRNINLDESYITHLKDQNSVLRNLADGEVSVKEFPYLNKKGEYRWIEIKSKVFSRDEKGMPNQILLLAADINDYKTNLLELAEAKITNKSILGAIRDLLIVVDRDAKYKDVISGLEFRLEDSSNLIGKYLFDVLSKKNAMVLKKLVNACLDTGEVQHYDFEHIYPDDRPNAFFSNYISRLNSDEVLIAVRNETQKKLAENSLDDKLKLLSIQNEQLEKFISKNSELERFAYIIAHDLKEPLRTINAISELIHLEIPTTGNKNLEELFGHLVKNSFRMNSLIEGVLAYSKIDGERNEKKINLDELVKNILFDLNSIILASNVHIEIEELASIHGDPIQIRQLFQNLISNAIKFQTNENPIVRVGKRQDQGITVYYVEDNGIGIETEFRESIFKMFKRVNNYEKYPGQGIGLALCKKIIDSHKGEIWLENPEKRGVRFCFTLN
jgi:PAS domain S-box-containing protein